MLPLSLMCNWAGSIAPINTAIDRLYLMLGLVLLFLEVSVAPIDVYCCLNTAGIEHLRWAIKPYNTTGSTKSSWWQICAKLGFDDARVSMRTCDLSPDDAHAALLWLTVLIFVEQWDTLSCDSACNLCAIHKGNALAEIEIGALHIGNVVDCKQSLIWRLGVLSSFVSQNTALAIKSSGNEKTRTYLGLAFVLVVDDIGLTMDVKWRKKTPHKDQAYKSKPEFMGLSLILPKFI